MQISRVREEDSGSYTCVAENSLGQENVTSLISVQICEKPHIPPINLSDNVLAKQSYISLNIVSVLFLSN